MRQGENSGTITHEIGHLVFRLPDLNNNPYVKPYRRVAAGTWDMMDRGMLQRAGRAAQALGGASDPRRGHAGRVDGSQPAGEQVHHPVPAAAVEPGRPGQIGARRGGGDGPGRGSASRHFRRHLRQAGRRRAGRPDAADDPATNPLSPGTPNYGSYTMEVVQRIGYDSFTPDNGVLIAKNKDTLQGQNGGPNGFNSYIWVIDAHPEDINVVDYVKPNGEKVMRTIADYRQLNDALFHAGLNSGSSYEWEDTPNRLHFYIVDLKKDKAGILSYILACPLPRRFGAAAAGCGARSQGRPESLAAECPGRLHPQEHGRGCAAPIRQSTRRTPTPS